MWGMDERKGGSGGVCHLCLILHINLCLSTEPGYYEDGKFGIRIENVVEIVAAPTKVCIYCMSFLSVHLQSVNIC